LGTADAGASSGSSIGTIGGLVARGDGAGGAKEPCRSADDSDGPSTSSLLPYPNPGPDDGPANGELADGLVADGVSGGGAFGELNSAQRGHFRFVSVQHEDHRVSAKV
jgi:hypothetical protein